MHFILFSVAGGKTLTKMAGYPYDDVKWAESYACAYSSGQLSDSLNVYNVSSLGNVCMSLPQPEYKVQKFHRMIHVHGASLPVLQYKTKGWFDLI